MPTYAAFLRGVSPLTLKMADLRSALADGGFGGIRTLLSSGNVTFTHGKVVTAVLERRIEAVLLRRTGRRFPAFVRTLEELRALLEAEPYGRYVVPAGGKRVVTFLREAPSQAPPLPVARDGACVVALAGREVVSAYVPGPKGPVFMTLIEALFGEEVTTRTWDTVRKVAG